MAEHDPRIEARMTRSVELLRARREPRVGAEDRILAQLEATVGGTPDGGGEGGAGPQAGAGSGGAGAGPLYAAKIVLATATLTALGLGALRLGAVLLGPSPAASPPPSARAEAPPSASEPAKAPVDASPPSEPVADEPEPPPAEVQPKAKAKASADPPTSPEDPGTPADADAVAAELALIEAARAAKGPRAVIEQLEAHAREFPEGLLVDERELLWTLADCERGQLDAATTRARSFIKRRPSSPLVDRMLHACPELEARMTKADQAGHG